MKTTSKFFGTDGIRGHVGEFPITADFLLKIGWAVGTVLAVENEAKVLIGKDTRISGYMIESALEAGLSAAGANIYLLGPIPTSAIAYLTRTLRAQIGIVISASHNPYDDNGIKFFSSEGYKTTEAFEQAIENLLDQNITTANSQRLGKAWRVDDASGRYIEFCKSSVAHHTNLTGLKLVIDCANGATYNIAPHVFRELGATVIELGVTPNGLNINENSGSNYPQVLQACVLAEKADVGIAFDGDGDRVIMVDHTGEILDGDELLYVITKGLLIAERFTGGVVGTQMTNMGLVVALEELNIPFIRVPVGDQHVIQGLIEKNWLLGGESSGHIVYLPVTTTADGIISALQVLQAMHVSGKSLHDLKQGMQKFPQRLINLPHNGQRIDLTQADMTKVIQQAEKNLGRHGRILLRYSGTEPVIRIMVEGENQIKVETVSQDLLVTIKNKIKSAIE